MFHSEALQVATGCDANSSPRGVATRESPVSVSVSVRVRVRARVRT